MRPLAHVVGELALQKFGGVLAGEGQQAQLRQVCQHRAALCRSQFVGWVAKVQHSAVGNMRALLGKKVLPGGNHGDAILE
jgi:hypothetical protein